MPRAMPNNYNARHSWNLKIDEHAISTLTGYEDQSLRVWMKTGQELPTVGTATSIVQKFLLEQQRSAAG